MGIYDRDYERDYGGQEWRPEGSGLQLRWPRSVHGQLIAINLIIWALQLVLGEQVWGLFSLKSDWWSRPWSFYQLLTYGFLHSPTNLFHVAFNMYGVWMFGRPLEERYGSREFLWFYLIAVVLGGLVWTLAELASPGSAQVLGASGA
ncbi:MAG: rhomboid family intramembrane serine protease, partial [Planctomycetota bacterium]